MFLVSFFLPSYDEAPGWICAILQRDFWWGAKHGDWHSIHYELLTLANLIMLASPLLVFRFEGNLRALSWSRHLTLSASLLVWSFIGLLLASKDGVYLNFGCYVWGVSFVLLHLSALWRPSERRVYV